jgi:uncharacterized protein (DUF2267 family)
VGNDEFINAVARRAGVSSEQARRITEATLETLADRITGGEADDIAQMLPDPLAGHLRKPPSRERANAFGLGEFVQRVSAGAGVDSSVARAGVRAVFTTVREAVPGEEFADLVAQLPREFYEMLEPVGLRAGGRRGGGR